MTLFSLFFGDLLLFEDDYLLISFFLSNNKQKIVNIATIYFFSEKIIIKDVFFNVFRSINGILPKIAYYAIWIKKKILPKKWLFQGFFHIFICGWKKTKKIPSLSRKYSFSLKLEKLPIFMLLSWFYDNIYFFSKTA